MIYYYSNLNCFHVKYFIWGGEVVEAEVISKNIHLCFSFYKNIKLQNLK